MGLEQRGNRIYYYRKERRGGRVVSIYVGSGRLALMAYEADKLDKEESKAHRERERAAEVDAETDYVFDRLKHEADLLVEGIYLANGYHKHSRQWRRKRGA